jgi:ketosteroid isomerase-like protein
LLPGGSLRLLAYANNMAYVYLTTNIKRQEIISMKVIINRKGWTIMVILFTLAVNQTNVFAQSKTEKEVIRVVDGFHAAIVAGDTTKALGFLAEDAVILESGGLENKQHYASGHIAGDMRFSQAVPRQRGEMKVNIVGDAAWTYTTTVTQGKMGEREINSQGVELVVLARDGSDWKIKAIHWSSRKRK